MNEALRELLSRADDPDATSGQRLFAELLLTTREQCDLDLPSHVLEAVTETYDVESRYGEFDSIVAAFEEDPARIADAYAYLVDRSYRRDEGQFFTPSSVAEFMIRTLPSDASVVLDPGVGPGTFSDTVLERCPEVENVVAVDRDPLMLLATNVRIGLRGNSARLESVRADFLTADLEISAVDAVVCNPPYNKFHQHDTSVVDRYESEHGVNLGGLTNIYPLFFLRASEYLSADGTMTFITPKEFFHSRYGVGLKRFLTDEFTPEAFVNLDWNDGVFDALTTAMISVLRPVDFDAENVAFVTSASADDLVTEDGRVTDRTGEKTESVPLAALDPDENWNGRFDSRGKDQLLEATVPLHELAETTRGIATGCNDFFTLTPEQVREWDVEEEYLTPVLAKARQASEYTVTEADFDELRTEQENVYLLYCETEPSEAVQAYLQHGKEEYDAHERYLTSNRDPWYAPETRDPAPILATTFSRDNMRFIHNEFGARNLAAFHGIYLPFDDEPTVKALLGYLNSPTALSLARAQKRQYADGLGKFEPGDLDEIPVLDVRMISTSARRELAERFEALDDASRSGDVDAAKRELDETVRDVLRRRLEDARKETLEEWL